MVPPKPNLSSAGPLPPPDLNDRELPLKRFPATTVWSRLHHRTEGPIFFGRSGNHRFDAPAQEFGVLYLGADVNAAFVETFLREPGKTLIAESDIEARHLSKITASRMLNLVEVTGPGLVRIGATAVVSSGPHHISQQWSLALWSHPQTPDGLLYRARHDDARFCAAVFDRVGDILTDEPIGPLTDDSKLLADLLDTYGMGLT